VLHSPFSTNRLSTSKSTTDDYITLLRVAGVVLPEQVHRPILDSMNFSLNDRDLEDLISIGPSYRDAGIFAAGDTYSGATALVDLVLNRRFASYSNSDLLEASD
jgi:hypothetical protein